MLFFGAKSGKKKVLLVDDDSATRGMLKMLLEDSGFEVSEAADGAAAVRQARAESPSLIILDINLPAMTGVEVLSVLRAGDATKAIPVIMCTAHNTFDDVERCLAAGARDYIQKPFDLRAVLAKVQRVLGG